MDTKHLCFFLKRKDIIMLISVCMVAYNEENTLHEILNDITAQTYPHISTELIFVDNNSQDATLRMLEEFRLAHMGEYHNIKVIHNDSSVLSSGLNRGFSDFAGDCIVRIDAHASLAVNFLEETVACLEGKHNGIREDVCGGARPTYTPKTDAMSQMLLSAEQSRFGASAANYRTDCERCYMDSIFHAAYRREVVEKVGLFNEELWRTEDNEYNHRVVNAGYKICFEPLIRSRQQIRPSLTKMLRQKRLNGYWIGYTLGRCPKCLSVLHFVPMAFLIANIVCGILALFGLGIFGALMWALYMICDIVFSVKAVIDSDKPTAAHLLLPVIFPIMHLVYGAGTVGGVFTVFFKKRKKEI